MSREMKNSCIPWIGMIPSTWQKIKVKQSGVKTGSGTTPKSEISRYYGGSIPWIQSGDLYGTDRITSTSKTVTGDALAEYSALKTYKKPFIVLAMYGASVGNIAISDIDACVNQACCVILPDTSNDISFLKYWLMYCKSDFIKQSVGSGQPNISQDKILNQVYVKPSISEQNAIAYYLDSHCSSIDSAISKHHQIIEKLEEYRKAVITQAVTKGLNQNVEMKYSCIPWVTSIPEKWSEQPLKLLFSNRKNKNTDCAETNLLSLSYGRIIRKDINSNEGLLPENFSGYNIIEPNDIVLRLTDLQNDHRSLRTGLVTEHGIITSAYVTLCPKANINSEYYHYLLHAYDVQKVFYTLGEGIRQSLKYEDLGKVLVPVPPRVEQDEIVHYLNAMSKMVDDVIDKHNQLISKLQEYKQSLIYNAVTGKIDCTTEA